MSMIHVGWRSGSWIRAARLNHATKKGTGNARHSDPGVGRPSDYALAAYRPPGSARTRVATMSTRLPTN